MWKLVIFSIIAFIIGTFNGIILTGLTIPKLGKLYVSDKKDSVGFRFIFDKDPEDIVGNSFVKVVRVSVVDGNRNKNNSYNGITEKEDYKNED